jgi:ribosomal-protein-alanine N-acetyltransferase
MDNDRVSRPTLTTERLILRPFVHEDAAEVTRVVSDRRIADTTINIPYPYDEGIAAAWIGTHADTVERDEGLTLAVTEKASGAIVGAIALTIAREQGRGELGYWVAAERWGRGYATEAARAMLGYAFSTLDLRRVVAHCLTRNPGSRRVMEKLGMQCEGRLREHVVKWDVPEDIWIYGILRDDWRPLTPAVDPCI